jgi:hypothetical protein
VRPDGFCYWHSAETADERAEARRRGGFNKSNRARARKRLPAGVMTTDELRGVLGMTIAKVLQGTVEPGVGNSVAALSRAYIAVVEAGAVERIEERLGELERVAARGRLA